MKNVTVVSWNIHGAKDKLESTIVKHLLCTNDIIFLYEIKSPLPINIPGYSCYRRPGTDMHRGGCAMFLKNSLTNEIATISMPHQECIALKLRFMPHTTIIGCYVAPSDSPYHSLSPLTEIQTLIENSSNTSPTDNYIVLGDLNARFGNDRQKFIEGKTFPAQVEYSPSPDPITASSNNAKYISSALSSSLVMLNGLQHGTTRFEAALTFRQRTKWVSELDVCLLSPKCIPAIEVFNIDQRTNLPSDHAPIHLCISVEKLKIGDGDDYSPIIRRAIGLGNSQVDETDTRTTAQNETHRSRRPIRMTQIDHKKLLEELSRIQPPDMTVMNTDAVADTINDVLYNVANASRIVTPTQVQDEDTASHERWKDLLRNKDSRELWKAIGWNGEIKDDANDRPSDEEFRTHFENLLNPQDRSQDVSQFSPTTNVQLPVTDGPISPHEVLQATKLLKMNKSGGLSGVPPGLLKLIPDVWVAFLAALFTFLLQNASYPSSWCYTKLIVLFKKGVRNSCDNYRGISLMESVAKLYDSILNRRLSLWFTPDREQAGSQKGRSCTEHIVALRLLIDFARHKRKKLYLIFVDFSKAYDRVPRYLLLQEMASLGCGSTMLKAIAAIYGNTKMILQTASITSSIGVRQGSPTSCFLFTLMVNALIKEMKSKCPPDGYLQWLHVLMLMDDTIILASNRQRAQEKVRILTSFCEKYGMVVNEKKTKFMVINGNDDDYEELQNDRICIGNCDHYTYLGCIFTQNGNLNGAVKKQCESKLCHVAKYEAFVNRHPDAPFTVKEEVLTAALLSAILYGVESWLSPSAINIAKPMYMQCIRILLGVRKTTAGDLCLVETGLPTLAERAKAAQKRTIGKMIQERSGMDDDPFIHIYNICRNANTPCSKYIDAILTCNPEDERRKLHNTVLESERTKFRTYANVMNPELQRHPMYDQLSVKEQHRRTTTRFRLASHNLAIEKGRWTRKPREERLCPDCAIVQDEQHALRDCRINQHERGHFAHLNLNLPEFFSELNTQQMTLCCSRLMRLFD